MRLKLAHIRLVPHEGVADDIRPSGNEPEVFEILRGERREPQVSVRKIDALVRQELRASCTRVGDRDVDVDTIALGTPNHPTDLAVIQPDGVVHPHLVEDLRKCHADGCWLEDLALQSSYGWPAWN